MKAARKKAPNILLHGSRVGNIQVLQPQKQTDGNLAIYATNDKRFALAMIHGSGKTIAVGYSTDLKTNKQQFYLKELKKEAFKELKQPGYIYRIKGEGFQQSEMKNEWKGETKTQVLQKEKIQNIYKALKETDTALLPYEEEKCVAI